MAGKKEKRLAVRHVDSSRMDVSQEQTGSIQRRGGEGPPSQGPDGVLATQLGSGRLSGRLRPTKKGMKGVGTVRTFVAGIGGLDLDRSSPDSPFSSYGSENVQSVINRWVGIADEGRMMKKLGQRRFGA